MISIENKPETTEYLIQRMLDKSGPLADGHKPHQVRQLSSQDTLFISGTRTELTPQSERLPSVLIFSPLARRLSLQNPDFLRNIFEGNYPQSRIEQDGMVTISSGSIAHILEVDYADQKLPLVVKYHDEGDGCYPHIRTGEEARVDHDKVSGIDNFSVLRTIDLFAPNLSVPEPVLGTRRLFVATFVSGEFVQRGQLPKWVKNKVDYAINQGYKYGLLRKPNRLFGILPKGFDIDLDTLGNVLIKDGRYYIIDPIL